MANQVARKVLERAEIGLTKYGVTCAREDLTRREWLQHLQEEMMDASVYLEKLLRLEPDSEAPEERSGRRNAQAMASADTQTPTTPENDH